MPMVLVFGLSSAPLLITVFMWHAVMAIHFTIANLMWGSLPSKQFRGDLFQTEADLQYLHDTVLFPLVMHHLNDIFGVHRPDVVGQQYNSAGKTLEWLGLFAKQSKDRPPATTQILLGLEGDTIKQEASRSMAGHPGIPEIGIPAGNSRKSVIFEVAIVTRKVKGFFFKH